MADSIREALTAAYATAEKEPDTAPVVDTTPEPVVESVQDSAVSTESVQTEKVDSPANAGAESASDSGSTTPAPAAAPAPAPEPEEKVPSSWSPAERAAWGSIPTEARKAVIRREQEIQRVLSVSSSARQAVETYDRVFEPFKPLLEKHGVTPAQAIGPLLATRAALELGSPQQKAELVANLIADFAVDHEELAAAITQRASAGPVRQAPPPRVDYRAVPELAPLFQLAEMAQQRQQAAAQEAVARVAAQPHFEEVRHTMADVLDQMKARGKEPDLDRAYTIACQIHGHELPAPKPSVSEAAATLARARNAASSVSGGPKPSAPKTPDSIRDHLEAAFAGR
jgi:hypothetical protein